MAAGSNHERESHQSPLDIARRASAAAGTVKVRSAQRRPCSVHLIGGACFRAIVRRRHGPQDALHVTYQSTKPPAGR
jgi:hypothetical protein